MGSDMLEGLETTGSGLRSDEREQSCDTIAARGAEPGALELEPDGGARADSSGSHRADVGERTEDADLVLEGNIEAPPKAPAAAPPRNQLLPLLLLAYRVRGCPRKPLWPAGGQDGRSGTAARKPVIPKTPLCPTATPGQEAQDRGGGAAARARADFETANYRRGPRRRRRAARHRRGAAASSFIQTEDETSISTGGRKSGFIDLGIDEISSTGDQAGSLVFSNIEETPAAPEIEELESRVATARNDSGGRHKRPAEP